MDETNRPKDINGKQWIHDLLDEELSDGDYKFEVTGDPNAELSADQFKAGITYQNSFKSTEAWESFKNHLDEPAEAKVVSLQWLKYAAMIALPLLVGSAIYFMINNKTESGHFNNQTTTLKRHSNEVMLVLEDGAQVNLTDSSKATTLANHVVNSAHQLDYSKSSATAAFNTLIVPKGATYKLMLGDGTQVWLNADTKIRYQVNFDATATREVYLENGEAFFKVTKNPEKPFILHKGDVKIQVLGTSFNVNTYSNVMQTTLVEGKVKIGFKNTDRELTLDPGQQANANLLTAELTKQNVDPSLYSAWKDGIIMINNTTMDLFMEDLGRLYDYEIVFEDQTLKKLHYNGSTDKTDNIRPLLDMIEKTTNVKFTIKDRRIIVKRDN